MAKNLKIYYFYILLSYKDVINKVNFNYNNIYY